MRVAHLAPALFGPDGIVGGAERYVHELAREMSTRVPTTLVSFGSEERVAYEDRLTVHVIRGKHVRGQRSNPFAWGAVRQVLRADVVHCHQQHILATTVAAVAARARRRRVFCTDLGGGGWDVSAFVSTDGLFDGHLHISQYSRRVFGHEGLRSARVVYGGVDTERFSPGDGSSRDIGCLIVGRLLPHKGIDLLLEALPPDLPTVVVGPAVDPRYLAALRDLARNRAVTLMHDVEDGQLVELYRRARCVALPSLYRDRYGAVTRVPELLGQTLLEGMACGAMGLCTDVASLPEVVTDGVTGRVVPPYDVAAMHDALCWIRDHPAAAAEMGRRGREDVLARFTWKAVVDRCLQAYASH